MAPCQTLTSNPRYVALGPHWQSSQGQEKKDRANP